jgi:hypothetical protein
VYYQLLERPSAREAPHYRGTYRGGPRHQDDAPEDAPINRAWRLYIEHDAQLPRRDLALQVADEMERHGLSYDVVRIDVLDAEPGRKRPGQLGFDVTVVGWYSFLSWGLTWNGETKLPPAPEGPLLRLVGAYFQPLLNKNGLFERWRDARFFADVLLAMSAGFPGTWESEDSLSVLQIVRLVCIRPGDIASAGD